MKDEILSKYMGMWKFTRMWNLSYITSMKHVAFKTGRLMRCPNLLDTMWSTWQCDDWSKPPLAKPWSLDGFTFNIGGAAIIFYRNPKCLWLCWWLGLLFISENIRPACIVRLSLFLFLLWRFVQLSVLQGIDDELEASDVQKSSHCGRNVFGSSML